jgi:hypothetical protein
VEEGELEDLLSLEMFVDDAIGFFDLLFGVDVAEDHISAGVEQVDRLLRSFRELHEALLLFALHFSTFPTAQKETLARS